MRACDRVIELGPGAGPHGGRIVFDGTPARAREAHRPADRARVERRAERPPTRRDGRAARGSRCAARARTTSTASTCASRSASSARSPARAARASRRSRRDPLPRASRARSATARSTGRDRTTGSTGIGRAHARRRSSTSRRSAAPRAATRRRTRRRGTASARASPPSPTAMRRGPHAGALLVQRRRPGCGRCEDVLGRRVRDGRDAVPRRRRAPLPGLPGQALQARGARGHAPRADRRRRARDDASTRRSRSSIPPDDARLRRSAARSSPSLRVGLGYLPLGQPLSTLSGGEAQRLKLARALSEPTRRGRSSSSTSRARGSTPRTPRTSSSALHALVDEGASVVVVEHDLDVIRACDWVIDLGPGRRAARRARRRRGDAGAGREERHADRRRAARDSQDARRARRRAAGARECATPRALDAIAVVARARAQPEGRLVRDPARAALRRHRAERLGQVVARVRRRLRRGAAALHGDAHAVRAAVPPDAAAARRRRRHRRAAVDRARAADVARRRELARSPR